MRLKEIAQGLVDSIMILGLLALLVTTLGYADIQIVGVTNSTSDITIFYYDESRNFGHNYQHLAATEVPIWEVDNISVTIEGDPEWVVVQVSYPKLLRLVGVHGCLDIQGIPKKSVDQTIVDGICTNTYIGR